MKGTIAALTAVGVLAAGGCSDNEKSTETHFDTSISSEIIDEHSIIADQMALRGMQQFLMDMQEGGARVDYDKDNCIYFETPDGAVILRNPITYAYAENDATVGFTVFGKGDSNRQEINLGYYEYTHPELKDDRIFNIPVMAMNPPSPTLSSALVTNPEGNDDTVWLKGETEDRISETKIIPFTETGMPNFSAINEASTSLCGKSIGLMETEG